jgi:hypothetical protein
MKKSQLFALALTLLLAQLVTANDRYEETPDQKIHPHIIDKDYTNVEFKQKWDIQTGFFTVRTLNVTEYDEVWQGVTRDFRGDNFYTLFLRDGQEATLAEYAYEAIKMTKAIVNYHCTNKKNDRPAKVDFKIYDHDRRIYYSSNADAGILEVDLKEATDVRMKFVNNNVRDSTFHSS